MQTALKNNSDLALKTFSSKFFACRLTSINSILLFNSSSAIISISFSPFRSCQYPRRVCAPDWAIAMKKNDVKHIFFVAETKGSMSSMDLSAIERAKIDCAEKLFNSISTANVKYHKVATYQDLIDGMNAIG